MSPSDPVGMDGEQRLSRYLKTEEFSQQRRFRTTQLHSDRVNLHPHQQAEQSTDSSADTASQTQFFSRQEQPAQSQTFRASRPAFHVPTARGPYQTAGVGAVEYPGAGSLLAVEARDHGMHAGNPSTGGLSEQIQRFLSDQVTPIRLASHLAVLAVAAVVLIVSQVELPDWQVSLRSFPAEAIPASDLHANASVAAQDVLGGATEAFERAVVFTSEGQEQTVASVAASVTNPLAGQTAGPVAAVRTTIETYVVNPGDTVLGIAARFDIKPETILWANPELEANPDLLKVGDRLVVLPVDGVLHVVQGGDTLSAIAARYKVTPQSIAEHPLNQMNSDINTPISIGTQLVIPNGTKPYIPRTVATYDGPIPESAARGSGTFGWPTAGQLTQPFWNGHRAIDIGARTGTSVTSADGGYIIAARMGGWNNGYGNMVVVDHGNGYTTLYAHLNSIYVKQGESVSKGQQLGTVGNTGNSTGPHLHFEVRYQGVPRNPFTYLP